MNNLTSDFILCADTIFDENTGRFNSIKSFGSHFTVDYKSCTEEEMKVITVDGNVTTINKSIDLQIAEGEFLGIAKILQILDKLKSAVVMELKEKNNHQDYFEAAIQNLIDQGCEVKTIATNGRAWIEIDFPEDFEA